uniref:Brain acid soluble protein 1 homolog n=1 Tax=Nicotiana tabacum TaxID=4097 RepID=A0A1S4DLG3_TOBAC
YTAPKKRARIGKGANTASGVAVDPLFDDTVEYPRGKDNPPTSSLSDENLREAIQMLTQIVASQAQRSNVAPTSSSQPGDSTSSRVNSQGAGRGTAQPSSSAVATSPAPPPARGSPAPEGVVQLGV